MGNETCNEIIADAYKLIASNKHNDGLKGEMQNNALHLPVDPYDLELIQKIRTEWDSVTDEQLADIRKYLGEGVSEYQFWLELRLSRESLQSRKTQHRCR
jgi:hypothetical protein